MVAFALGLTVLLGPIRADEPILLRYRPKLGRSLATRRTVEGVFDLPRVGAAHFELKEYVTETPRDQTPSITFLDVVTDRDEASLNGVAVGAIAALRSREFLEGGYGRDGVLVGLLGDRSTTGGLLGRAAGAGLEFGDAYYAENSFLFPDRSIVPGFEWTGTGSEFSRSNIEGRGISFGFTLRYEARIVVDGELIALISINPAIDFPADPFFSSPGLYGAWAVRIADGVTLRTSRVIRLYGRGSGTIREESALDGAPSWARINAERWRETLAGLSGSGR